MIRTMSMRDGSRSGFTLIELLVATGVFMIGFSAAFGLFLAAMKYRTMADDTVKLSLAASSIVEEMAVGGIQVNSKYLPLNHYPEDGSATESRYPKDYRGPGGLVNSTKSGTPETLKNDFFPYPGIPGTWFSIERCTSLLTDDPATPEDESNNPASSTLHVSLLVLVFTQADPTQALPLDEVNRRVRILTPSAPAGFRGTLTPAEEADIRDGLVKRGLAMRVTAVVLRRPSWM